MKGDKEKEKMDKENVDFSGFENRKCIVKTNYGSTYTATIKSISGTQIIFIDKYNTPVMLDVSVITSIVPIYHGNSIK